MNNIVKTATSKNGKYRINVMYDECPMCPCTEWDMVGAFLFEYRDGSTLHQECNWRELYGEYGDNRHSLEDALRKLISDYVSTKYIVKFIQKGYIKDWIMRYDASDHLWYLENYTCGGWYKHEEFEPSDLKNFDYTYELTEFMEKDDLVLILQDYGKDIVVSEFSLTGYCQGDYIEGVAFCDKKRFEKMCDKDTKNWKKRAEDCIEGDVECVNRWMWGDVYGYTLEERRDFTKTYEDGTMEEDCEWVETDSCWGYFCEPDEVIKENLPEDNLGMVG